MREKKEDERHESHMEFLKKLVDDLGNKKKERAVREEAKEREIEDDKIREKVRGSKEEMKIEIEKMKRHEWEGKRVEAEEREKNEKIEWKESEERLQWGLELVRRSERRRNLIIEGLKEKDKTGF